MDEEKGRQRGGLFCLVVMMVASVMVHGAMVVMRPDVMMVASYVMMVTSRVMVMLDLLNQATFILNRHGRQWRRVGIYHANAEAQHYTEK